MPTFKPDQAELHMGILQNRKIDLEGKLRACMLRMDQEGVDKESMELESNSINQKLDALEAELTEYENKVLELTKL